MTGRTFPLDLALVMYQTWINRSLLLTRLVERFDQALIFELWRAALVPRQDDLLTEILEGPGWSRKRAGGEPSPTKLSEVRQQLPVQTTAGLDGTLLEEMIISTSPLAELRARFGDDFDWHKRMTSYQALHLIFDGFARLVEALIETFGKQGELVAYDLHSELWRSKIKPATVEAFLAKCGTLGPDETIFSAGLDLEVVHRTERSVKMLIHQCAWARYFREHHPSVGYLIACSGDELAYRHGHKALRMRRNGTLLTGAPYCDFEAYVGKEV